MVDEVDAEPGHLLNLLNLFLFGIVAANKQQFLISFLALALGFGQDGGELSARRAPVCTELQENALLGLEQLREFSGHWTSIDYLQDCCIPPPE